MTTADANHFYQEAIDACEAIIQSGRFGLYRPEPADPKEAAKNYHDLFADPNIAPEEVMFIKGYSQPGVNTSHDYGIWYNPVQVAGSWPHPGRMNPTLELVDLYDSYSDPGKPGVLQTRVDGNTTDYNGFNKEVDYLRFNDPTELFADKDARLHATVIVPGSQWKGQTIIIQGGFVKPDGTAVVDSRDVYEHNGVRYYTFGAENANQYSGFDTQGGNYTRTGFSFKKFLQENVTVTAWNQTTNDFAEMRYAEVLLNYAEAVVESGSGDRALAEKGFHAIRRRAGHTVTIPFTLENVLRERQIELAFENKRNWDMIRRREFQKYKSSYRFKALYPLLDLRVEPAQYIFVRNYVPRKAEVIFLEKHYYQPIPGIGSNGLVQNPQY